ncbi:unnamed protein product [Somion occarium]|uniref:F-box domain-containing protein n=1 Tax=Somion occarium TaxID=3059160 RepID=A0ABP1DI88_9APHY
MAVETTDSYPREGSWISRLPNELLEKIFMHLRDATIINQSTHARDAHSWVRVCGVCRLWCEVALQCSALWSYISGYTKTADQIEMMLKRSKQSPLTVHLNSQSLAIGVELLDKHDAFQRLAVAVLRLDHESAGVEDVEMDRRRAEFDATALRDLTLNYDWPSGDWLRHPARMAPFSSGNLPKLSRLQAKAARFLHVLPFLRSTVTNLSLCLIDRPCMAQFVGALKAMPLLQALSLSFALPLLDSGYILPPYHFEYVQHLTLIDLTATCAQHLASFSFPSNLLRTFHVICRPFDCSRRQEKEQLEYLPEVASTMRKYLVEPLRTLSIRRVASTMIELCGWSSPHLPTLTSETPPVLSLTFTGCQEVDDVHLIKMLLDQFSVVNVKSLHVGNLDLPHSPREHFHVHKLPGFTLRDYDVVSSRFSRLEYLEVDPTVALGLLDALMLTYPLDQKEVMLRVPHRYEEFWEHQLRGVPDEEHQIVESRKPQLLFPNLKALAIVWVESDPLFRNEGREEFHKEFMKCGAAREIPFDVYLKILPG